MMPQMKWSQQEYTLREFEYEYEYHLPCIVEITQGYCGYGEEFFTFSTNEVYRIDKLASQSRIVAKAENGIHYSIPVAYPLKFKISSKTSWGKKAKKAMYLEEILSVCAIDEQERLVIIPEDGDKLKFWQGADRRSTVHLDHLEVISEYEDKYFVANSFLDGQLWDGLIMPIFVGIKLRVAEGLLQGGQSALQNLLSYMAEKLGAKNDRITGNREIMIFDSNVSEHSEYDYLQPSTYVSCNQVSRLRQDVVYESPKRTSRKMSDNYSYMPLRNTEANRYQDHYNPYSEVVSSSVSPGVKALTSQLNRTVLERGRTLKEHKPGTPPKPLVSPKPGGTVKPHTRRELPDLPAPQNQSATQAIRYSNRSSDPKPVSPVKPLTPAKESSSPVWPPHAQASGEMQNKTGKKKEKIYETYKDVPKSVKHMSKREVADCLRLMGLEKYMDVFLQNDVDGTLLMELDSDILTSDPFCLSKFESIKVTKFAKSGWRPTD